MIDVPTQIHSDSSAARSVARRRGIGGRLRHLQTRHLWLQNGVALGHLKLDVVAGEKIQGMCSRNHCQDAKFENGQNMLAKMVAAIMMTTTTNDGKHREQRMMANIVKDCRQLATQSAAAAGQGSLDFLRSQQLQQQQTWLRTSRTD